MRAITRAFCLLIGLLSSQSVYSQSDIFSFAVKGGVSLGSYEAGLNWVYLEEIKRRQYELNTFTGASAGSINALMSAIRYCEENLESDVDNNIFRQTWDIGMEQLVGENDSNGQADYRDFIDDVERNISSTRKNIIGSDRGGLFNRSGLLNSLQHIYSTIQNSTFKEGCTVKVGISVTKFIPNSYSIDGINIKNQRYIIPFIVKVIDGKLIFANTPYFNDNKQDTSRINSIDHFIFLPQGKSGISVFDIFRAVIASSAFPVAFPPVHLEYCLTGGQLKTNSGIVCPNGYVARKDLFIDGGSFDNAPIGTARRLSLEFSCSKEEVKNCRVRPDEKFNLIYVNPGSIRERQKTTTLQDDTHNKGNAVVGMIDHIFLAGHIMEYGMSAELYRSLTLQKNDGQVSLSSSSRFYPLVGDFIEHFGAFFDSAYRRFDYYVGVYDGIINVANYLCRNDTNPSKCKAEETKHIIQSIHLEKNKDSSAYLMFVLLASKEFHDKITNDSWRWLFEEYERLTIDISKKRIATTEQGKVIDIFFALDLRNCIAPASCDQQVEPPGFKGFLGSLTETSRYDENTRKMVKSPNNWNHAILDGMLKRAIAVEEMKLHQIRESIDVIGNDASDKRQKQVLIQEKESQQILVSGLEIVSLYGQSFFKRNSRGYWPASTTEETCFTSNWTWKCLIPDEFGMHSDNVGGYISYRLQFPSIFQDQSIDIGLDPLHFALNTDDYASAEALYRFENRNIFVTSAGLGIKFYRTIGEKDRFVDAQYFGVVAKIGLFSDKLKISTAYRLFDNDVSKLMNGGFQDLYSGEINYRQRIELTIGINDLRGISNILF